MFGLINKLEDCDPLFKKFLSPWYPEKERQKITRPDMYVIAGYEGQPLAHIQFPDKDERQIDL